MKKIILILILFILYFKSYANDSLEKINLQLQWKHQFEFAGFYIAKEKGFFKEVGLDVEFIEFNNNTNIIQTVLDNENTYGITYSNLISEYFNGKPLVFVANFFKQSPLALVTQKEISSPSDLKNKKIMGVSDQIHSSMFLLIFKRFNIKTNDFNSIPPTFNIEDFITKKVDAMTVFTTNETYFLDKINYNYNLIDPTIFGAEFYDLNLFTSQKELKKHPFRVEKFKQASIKGWEYALKNKDEAIEIILKKYNTQNKTKDALLYEANKIEKLMMPSIYPIGSIDKNRVQLIIDDLINLDLISKIGNNNLDNLIYEKTKLPLTDEEISYLENKKELKICIHPKWYPFEAFDSEQKHIGISKDYLDLISKYIKKDFTLIPTGSWDESLEFIENKYCDILPIGIKLFTDKDYLTYTNSYFSTDLVMIGRKNDSTSSLKELKNKTVGICKNLKLSNELKEKYSNIKFLPIENYVKGFELLSQKKIDGYINALPVMSNYLQNNYAGELKIITKLDEKLDFSLSVRKDEPILRNILNKSISIFTKEDEQKIRNKYLVPVIEKERDLTWLKIFLLIILIIIVYLLFKQYISYQVTKLLKSKIEIEIQKSKQKDNMIYHQNKLIAMGEMIENIAHQWKQPLNELNCNVILIDEELHKLNIKNNASINEYLTNIENLTLHMAQTINDFRKFYSKEKEYQKFDIESAINDTLKIVQNSFNQENIYIEKNIEEKLYLENYLNEFKQVILSILHNSKEAFKNKNIEKKIITITAKKESNKLVISIKDNAGGIKKEIINQIFNQYFTTKKSSNSSGLGLYISKMIIEEHMNGLLKVESKNDETIFSIIF